MLMSPQSSQTAAAAMSSGVPARLSGVAASVFATILS